MTYVIPVCGAAGSGQAMVDATTGMISNPFNAQKPSTATLFGDSYSSFQQDSVTQSNTDNSTYAASSWSMLIAMLGDAIDVNTYAGVGGDRSSDMLARIQADVLDIGDEWVFMQFGSVNDFFPYSRSAVDVYADVVSMIDQIIANGQKVYGQNCAPQNPTRGDYSAAKAIQLATFNEMIAEYVRTTNGVLMGDVYSYAVDQSDNASGGAMANKYIGTDKIHFNIYGAYDAGVKGIQDLAAYFPPARHRKTMSPVTTGDYWSLTESNFNGTGGSHGTASSGDVSTGWIMKRKSGTGAIVGSYVDGDFNGTITLSGAASSVYSLSTNDLATLFGAGGQNIKSKLIMSFDMTGGIVLEEIRVYSYTYDGTVFKTTDWGRSVNGYTALPMPELANDIQIDLQASLMPANPVDVNIIIEIRVSGTGTGILIPKHLRILDA